MKTLMLKTTTPVREHLALAVLIVGTIALLVTLAALNGGVAPTASVWDGLVTYLKGLLTSTWVLVLAFIALIAAVWQLAHGRGYGGVALILGILAIALLGPGLVTSIATSTRMVTAQQHSELTLRSSLMQSGTTVTAAQNRV